MYQSQKVQNDFYQHPNRSFASYERAISIKIYIKSSQFRDRSVEQKNSRNIYKILTKSYDDVISWFTHKSCNLKSIYETKE